MRAIAIGVGLVVLASAMPASADDQDAADIRRVLERFDRAYESKDIDALAALVAPDPDTIFFMPDVGSRWVGVSAIKAGIRADLTRIKSLKIEAQTASVHVRGAVAWFERTLVFNLVGPEGEASFFARSSGVLEKRGAQWLIVQQHVSAGAPRDSAPKD